MKKILMIAVVTAICHSAWSQGHEAKPNKKQKHPADHDKGSTTRDHAVIYTGTSDFYLALEREGLKIA
jgi:hypothetical protein